MHLSLPDLVPLPHQQGYHGSDPSFPRSSVVSSIVSFTFFFCFPHSFPTPTPSTSVPYAQVIVKKARHKVGRALSQAGRWATGGGGGGVEEHRGTMVEATGSGLGGYCRGKERE